MLREEGKKKDARPPSVSLQPTDCSRHAASNSRFTPQLIRQDRSDSIPAEVSRNHTDISHLLALTQLSLRVSSVTDRKDPTWQKHGSATQITALVCSRDKKINQTLEIPLAATKLAILRKNKTSYLRPIASAGRAGSRQTARQTSFWLPGAFPSSTPALYTCRRRLKVRGRGGGWAAVTLGNCTHTSHQRVGAAARPDQGEEGREAGIQGGENGRLCSGSWLCGMDGKFF